MSTYITVHIQRTARYVIKISSGYYYVSIVKNFDPLKRHKEFTMNDMNRVGFFFCYILLFCIDEHWLCSPFKRCVCVYSKNLQKKVCLCQTGSKK